MPDADPPCRPTGPSAAGIHDPARPVAPSGAPAGPGLGRRRALGLGLATVLAGGLGGGLAGCAWSGADPAETGPVGPGPTDTGSDGTGSDGTGAGGPGTVPTGRGPWFGLNVPYAAEDVIDALARRLDHAPVLVSRFVKLDSTLSVSTLARTGRDGRRIPVMTLEPWSYVSRSGEVDQPGYSLQSLVDGRHDADLRRLARVFAGYGQEVMVRFAHEMNADWYPWAATVNGNSPELYVRAWRHVRALVKQIAPRTRWVWAPVAAWWEEQQALDVLYPGDQHVDYLGVTGYGRTADAGTTFDAWWAEVRSFSAKPVILTEIGAAGEHKVAWIASLTRFLTEHDTVRGFVWFNTTPASTGATGDYRFDDTPEHLAAFRRLLEVTDATTG